jgi:hypothetical protein
MSSSETVTDASGKAQVTRSADPTTDTYAIVAETGDGIAVTFLAAVRGR